MKHLIRLIDWTKEEVFHVFAVADALGRGEYRNFLAGKTVVLFFSASSIRTRLTFEKGIHRLGGQTVLFPPEALDKKEDIGDVAGYLSLWADAVVVRHGSIGLLEKMAQHASVPVINAMTNVNHPCEVLSDLYALSKLKSSYLSDKYLFCGRKGNIGLAWKELADVMELDLSQCCPAGYEMEGVPVYHDLRSAVSGKDVVCTDSLPGAVLPDFADYQITPEIMELANDGAVLNPCPPFYRGEEVSAAAIDSGYFVGCAFKKHLLEIEQAVLITCMT